MAQTVTKAGTYTNINRRLVYLSETGSANTQLASTTSARGNPFRIVAIIASYSAAPTQTGVIVTLVSGLGSGFNATLNSGSANAQYTVYIPTNDLILSGSDTITVTAPAAGGVITASVQIIVEELG